MLPNFTNRGFQVTAQQADAADEDAIKGICERATKEEGRLDVFFANVCLHLSTLKPPV